MANQIHQTGEWGESTAADFLRRSRGMRLLDQRWRWRHGELDLILREGRAMVFAEVRVRTNEPDPLATFRSIRRAKWKVLRATALAYIRQSPWKPEAFRFDVVGIRRYPDGTLQDIQHWTAVRCFGSQLRF